VGYGSCALPGWELLQLALTSLPCCLRTLPRPASRKSLACLPPCLVPACAGSAVMAKVLDTAVPRFLQQLAVDYAAWAAGDETRQPVGNGSILDDIYEASPDKGEAEQGWD